MASITFGGLASGMDTAGIVTSLVAAESIPLTQIQNQKSAIDRAKTDVSSFMSRVSDLQAAAKALADPLQWNATKATSSDPAVVATTSLGSAPGVHSIEVTSLARESRHQSLLQSSSTDTIDGEGLLTLHIGDTSADVSVTLTDSLTDIASKINSSGLRAQASVLYDGSKYRIVVRGLDSGESRGVTFDEGGTLATKLGLSDPANKLQAATDAKLKVDGIEITRPTNQIAGALPGVTLALTKETTSAAQLTVAPDSEGLSTKVKAFVTAYNAAVSASHLMAGYGSTKGNNALLQGDSAFRSTLDTISRIVGTSVSGTGGKSLGLAGLSTQKDGSLTFDDGKLRALVASDPTSARKLFTTDPSVGATGAMGVLSKALDTVAGTNGTLQHRIDGYAERTTRLDQSADALTRRIAAYKEQIQKQFGAMETAFSVAKTQTAALASLLGSSSSNSSSNNG